MSAQPERRHGLVQRLERLAADEDRAALAALRRGLGKAPGDAPEMFRYVVPFIPQDASPYQEAPYYLIASLFALHPSSSGSLGNLGASFRLLDQRSKSESTEKRFVALLNARRDDLPDHLRHAVSLLRAHEVPVDWERLLRDTQRWDSQWRGAQRDWAREFWRDARVGDGEQHTSDATESARVDTEG